MIGAIIGDAVGAPYEFGRKRESIKSKEFPLFSERSYPTDDSVMTVAVAEALMKSGKDASEDVIKRNLVDRMQYWGHKFPGAGYGRRFHGWLSSRNPQPYNSYGNGSAMRVSSVGWLYDTEERVLDVARWTAEVTHNHPEGIKGAQAVAMVIFLARNGKSKEEIKKYVEDNFGYDLNRTIDEIRPKYHHHESCQLTVPEAIISFLEGNDYEDVIRNAVSLGGDADTLGAIAGSMAEALYDIPQEIIDEVIMRMETCHYGYGALVPVVEKFYSVLDEWAE